MDGIWPFRLSRRADAAAVPRDRDFEPLFNFLAQPPRALGEARPADGLSVAPAAPVRKRPVAAHVPTASHSKPAVTPVKSPAAMAATGLLRQLRSAKAGVARARKRVLRAAAAQLPASKSDRVRVWIDLDELASNVVRADGKSPTAADAADWLLRLNFLFDGEAWQGDRDDLKLLGGFGVIKVRRGE